MSRRYSPRALNNRTGRDDSQEFILEDELPWMGDDDVEEEVDDLDEDDDEYDDFCETEYDQDWDSYWRQRRRST